MGFFKQRLFQWRKNLFKKCCGWNFGDALGISYTKILQQTLQISWESPKWLRKFPSVEIFFRRGTRKLMEKDIQKKVQNGLALLFERAVMFTFNRGKSIDLIDISKAE